MAAPIEDERRLGAQAALTDPNLAPWSSGGYWPGLPVRRARLDVSLAGTAVRMEVRSRAAARNRNPGQNQPVGRVASSAGLQTCRRADVQTFRRSDVQTFTKRAGEVLAELRQRSAQRSGGQVCIPCLNVCADSLGAVTLASVAGSASWTEPLDTCGEVLSQLAVDDAHLYLQLWAPPLGSERASAIDRTDSNTTETRGTQRCDSALFAALARGPPVLSRPMLTTPAEPAGI